MTISLARAAMGAILFFLAPQAQAAFDAIPITRPVEGGLEVTCQYGYIRNPSRSAGALSAPLDMEGGFTYRLSFPGTAPDRVARFSSLPDIRRRICPDYHGFSEFRNATRRSRTPDGFAFQAHTERVAAFFRDQEHVEAAVVTEGSRLEPALAGSARFNFRGGSCALGGRPRVGSRAMSSDEQQQVCLGLRMKMLRDGLRGCLDMVNTAISPDGDRTVPSVNDMVTTHRRERGAALDRALPEAPSSAMCSALPTSLGADRGMLMALINEILPSGCDGVRALRGAFPAFLNYDRIRDTLHIRGRSHAEPPSLLVDYMQNAFAMGESRDALGALVMVRMNHIVSSRASCGDETDSPVVEDAEAPCNETWARDIRAVLADRSALTSAVCDRVFNWRAHYTASCRNWILGGRTDRGFRIAPPRASSPNSLLRARSLACRCIAAFPDRPRSSRRPNQPMGDPLPRGETCATYQDLNTPESFNASMEYFGPETVGATSSSTVEPDADVEGAGD